MKYDLLSNAYMDVRDKVTNRIVRLHRLICLAPLKTAYGFKIDAYTVGGWVESLDCLDMTQADVWVAHDGKVFGNAKISNGAIICDNAVISGDSKIIASKVGHHAHVWGAAIVDSSHVDGTVDIAGSAHIIKSHVMGASKLFESAIVENSIISGGAIIRGTSYVRDSEVGDVAEVNGDSVVELSYLFGRTVITNQKLSGERIKTEVELKVRNGK